MNTTSTPSSTSNPYAAPQGDLSEQRAPDEAELAGRGRRLASAFIDGVIMILLAVAPVIAFVGGWSDYQAKAAAGSYMLTLGSGVFGIVVYLLVNGYFLAKDGQSIGKKLLGTKIVRTDGSKADFVRIVTRRFLPAQALNLIPMVGILLAVVDVLFIFRASKKCIHDDIADTVVIRIS